MNWELLRTRYLINSWRFEVGREMLGKVGGNAYVDEVEEELKGANSSWVKLRHAWV